MKFVSLLFLTLTTYSSAQSIYPFETWMSDLPSSADFYSKTIFDIVLPGSRHAGMVSDDISNANTPSTATNPSFAMDYSRISSLSAQDQALWSARQEVSILNQLRSGSRFLDLHIEASGNGEYNAYNALLGADIATIIDEIYTFFSDYHANNEIIVLYLSGFVGDNTELQGLYDTFSNSDLHSKMVDNSIDLTTKTLQSMLDDGSNIIAFTDDVTNAPNTFFDSNAFLHIPTTSDSNLTLGQMDEVHEVRTFVTSNIRYGWPSNALNLIYWTLDIAPFGAFTPPTNYESFREFNIPIAFELKHTISRYPKLRFGNVLLMDFITSSDAVEQAIVLNYQHSQCHDLIWSDDSTGCPSLTSLPTYFKYDDPSSPCSFTTSNLDINCKRSCGFCNISMDIPGSSCNTSTDCSSPLYDAYGSHSGECFIRNGGESRFISEPSFCLGLATYEACGDYSRSKMCGNDTHSMDILVAECPIACSADYQCSDGYCNSEWSICMTLNEATTTAASLDLFSDLERYVKFESDSPAQFRSDIDMFRPGDPEADYPEDGSIQCTQYTVDCFMENMDANPYVTSILGLLLMIIMLSLSLCVCFTTCCPFWCLCDRCCKQACCRPCYGDAPSKHWSMVKRWNSCLCLSMVTIIVCAFAIQGIVANKQLYSDIFDESDHDSFVSASDRLFSKIDDKFGSVSNITAWVTDNVEDVLDSVDEIMGDDGTSRVHDGVDDMYHELNKMATKYADGISLSGQVIDPFTQNATHFMLRCRYCDTIYDTVLSVNDTIKEDSHDALNDISSVLDDTSELVNTTDEISNITNDFQKSIDKILEISNDTQVQYYDYLDKANTYHTTGELFVTVLFALVFIFVIFPIFGVATESKWLFKINWCLAMYCSVLFLLISVPFVFMLTLSGDFCVRLDEFEDALPTMNSRLGRDIFNDSVVESMSAQDTLDVIDTCFDGGSVFDVFNLSDLFNFSGYRQQMEDALNIDIVSSFTIHELESLQTEIDTLSTDEYSVVVDDYIRTANLIPGCQCVDAGVAFDRDNLNPGTQCTHIGYSGILSATEYWRNASITCLNAFKNATFAVQIENDTLLEAQQKIAVLQQDVQNVFDIYDSVYEEANVLVDNIQKIGCEVEPLFAEFDELLIKFSNCGFMGQVYEDFKTVGCQTIFSDVYIIARSIMIIAFLCLLIVLWSLCLDYVYVPIEPDVFPIVVNVKKHNHSVIDINDHMSGDHRASYGDYDEDIDIEMQSVSQNKLTPHSSAEALSTGSPNTGPVVATSSPSPNVFDEGPPDGALTIPIRVKSNSSCDIEGGDVHTGFDGNLDLDLDEDDDADDESDESDYTDPSLIDEDYPEPVPLTDADDGMLFD